MTGAGVEGAGVAGAPAGLARGLGAVRVTALSGRPQHVLSAWPSIEAAAAEALLGVEAVRGVEGLVDEVRVVAGGGGVGTAGVAAGVGEVNPYTTTCCSKLLAQHVHRHKTQEDVLQRVQTTVVKTFVPAGMSGGAVGEGLLMCVRELVTMQTHILLLTCGTVTILQETCNLGTQATLVSESAHR